VEVLAMSTIDELNATTRRARFAGQSKHFAVWRLHADAQYPHPDAWNYVERLKAACADEARANRERTARTIAAFAR
jgi:hypothetical protein